MRLVLHRAAKLILSATTYNVREWTDAEIKNTLDRHWENFCGTPGSHQPTAPAVWPQKESTEEKPETSSEDPIS